jgi:SHS2 domain-containing protein
MKIRMNNHSRFEEVEHTADIAIRVWGRDLAELFTNAAYGMASQLGGTDSEKRSVEQLVELQAYDTETLLVSWLGELLYLSEREESIFTDFEMVEITPTRLRAIARGGPMGEHKQHIKAVTFSDLEIVRTKVGYETMIVFDV